MSTIIFQLLFLLIVLGVGNIGYKGKSFDGTQWKKIALLSGWFIVCSLILLWNHYRIISVSLDFVTLGIFAFVTMLWILSPVIIRRIGSYPDWYLKDKTGNARFMVRFEYPSMTVKYFEVLFQQASFLYIIFIILSGLPEFTLVLRFTFIVAVIHLGNLLFFHYKWALFYFALSIPMALLFGLLIHRGLIFITTSVHLLFYLVFNARYWFLTDSGS